MVRTIDSRSVLGVSHPLGGFLRVGAAGLLHPATGSGVRCVSRRPTHPLLEMGSNLPFPATLLTLRRVPLVSSSSASLRSSASLPFPSVLPGLPCPSSRRKGVGERPPAIGSPGFLGVAGWPEPPWPEAEAPGIPKGTSRSGRSRPRSPDRPKPAGPPSVHVESRFHRGGRLSDRQGGRLVPSRPESRPAEAGPGDGVPFREALDAEASIASRGGAENRCLPKQVRVLLGGSVPACAGPCLPGGCALPTEAGSGGPAGR
jgi:hypothetical protein